MRVSKKLRSVCFFRSKGPGKFFFGWYTVLAAFIHEIWSTGTWFYGFGPFFKPLMDEFNWTRAEVSAAWSIGRFEAGLEGPFGGLLADKFGSKKVNLLGVLLAGLGLCLMYSISSLLSYYIIYVIAMMGFNTGFSRPLNKAISDWFVKKRGLAIGIALLGRAVSGVMPPLLTLLLILYGWRSAFLTLGLLTWIILIPPALFLVKSRRPEYYGLLPDGEKIEGKTKDTAEFLKVGQEYARKVGEVEFTLRQALKTRKFRMLIIAGIFSNMLYPVVSVHIIPHLTDIGLDPITAATAISFLVFMSAPGRFFSGIAGDRLSKYNLNYLLMLSGICHAIGMLILLNAKTMWMVYACLPFFGLGVGIASASRPLLMARYFGRKAFATIWGIWTLLLLPTNIIAPIFAGWMYDTTGSYANAFSIVLALNIVGIVLYFFVRPPKPPAKVTEINDIF